MNNDIVITVVCVYENRRLHTMNKDIVITVVCADENRR